MHCRACDAMLTDYDVTIKSIDGYLDLCGRCRASISDYIPLVADDIINDADPLEDVDFTGDTDVYE